MDDINGDGDTILAHADNADASHADSGHADTGHDDAADNDDDDDDDGRILLAIRVCIVARVSAG